MFRNRLSLFSAAALGCVAGSQPAFAASSATDLCQKVVASYKKLIEANLNVTPSKSFYPDSPLTALNDKPDSGISTMPYVAEAGKEYRPYDWARHQEPPLTLSAELQDRLGRSDFLDRLPSTGFYAASNIQGTLFCYDSVYFQVKDGRAELAKGPPNWPGEDGEGCGVYRDFGKVGATPVAFEERFNYSPSLTSQLSVSGWTGGGFGPACTITFHFLPRFSPKETFNAWNQSCRATSCAAMRQAALHLVEMVQADPGAAKKTSLARLTAAQRSEFQAMVRAAQLSRPEKLKDPADLLDTAPLALPLIVGKTLHLARVGHFTIGWRIFSDWSVKLDQRDGGRLEEIAAIAIGMSKGKLLKADVVKSRK